MLRGVFHYHVPIPLFAKGTLHCFPALPMKWQVPLIDTFYFITHILYKKVIFGNWKCSTVPDLMNMRWKRIREFERTEFVTKLRTLVRYCVRGRIMKDWNNWFIHLTEACSSSSLWQKNISEKPDPAIPPILTQFFHKMHLSENFLTFYIQRNI